MAKENRADCLTCGGEGYVTATTPCKDPDHCIDGGPVSGVHEFDVLCPCCQDEDDEDEDDEDDEED